MNFRDFPNEGDDQFQPPKQIKTDPSLQDTFVCYATTAGNVSWRDEQKGDWFTYCFVEALAKHAHNHNFDELMILVQNKLNEISEQYQLYQSIIIKKRAQNKVLYLNPGLYRAPKRKLLLVEHEHPLKKIRVI